MWCCLSLKNNMIWCSRLCWQLAEDLYLCDSVARGAFPPFFNPPPPIPPNILCNQNKEWEKRHFISGEDPYWLVSWRDWFCEALWHKPFWAESLNYLRLWFYCPDKNWVPKYAKEPLGTFFSDSVFCIFFPRFVILLYVCPKMQIGAYKKLDLTTVDYLLSIILSKLDLCRPTLTKDHRRTWSWCPPPPSSAGAAWSAGEGSSDGGRGRSGDCQQRKHRQQRWWQRQQWWQQRQHRTVMAGAQTTINNQLKAVAVMVTEMSKVTAMMKTTATRAMAAASGNGKVESPPPLSTNLHTVHRGAAPREDNLATFGIK